MQVKKKNIQFVSENYLCCGCGTCVIACKQKAIRLIFDDKSGLYIPIVDENKCIGCGECIIVCPGINPKVGNNKLTNYSYLGEISGCYYGWSLNKEIRLNGASGGIATTILNHLFSSKEIDGAIVVKNIKGTLLGESYIASSPADLLESQQSKYFPIPTNLVLDKIKNTSKKYAYVGLPCQIVGLRNLQKKDTCLKESITCVVGLFCSRMPSLLATNNLLWELKIKEEEVEEILYRDGDYPGNIVVRLKTGKEVKISHSDDRAWGFNFFYYHQPPRCWLCDDHLASYADISIGDGKGAQIQREGVSTIITRTFTGDRIFQELINNAEISFVETNQNNIIRYQQTDFKSKINSRIYLWEKSGYLSPNYGHDFIAQKNIKERLAFFRVFLPYKLNNPVSLFRCVRLDRKVYKLRKKFNGFIKRINRKINKVFQFIKAFMPISQKNEGKSIKYRNPKICTIGGYGHKDIGDEAMPRADLLWIRNRIPNVEITMISSSPNDTSMYHHEYSIHDIDELQKLSSSNYKDFLLGLAYALNIIFAAYCERVGIRIRMWKRGRIFLDELKNSSVLLNVGGGNLNSLMRSNLYKRCVTFGIAHILKIPVIISGQTIGPFNGRKDELFAKIGLNFAKIITFRDNGVSRKRVIDIGITKPRLMDTADDAMKLPSMPKEEAKLVFINEVSKTWMDIDADFIVALNFKASLSVFKDFDIKDAELKNEIELLALISDYILSNYNVKLLFIPTCNKEKFGDRYYHDKVFQLIENKSRVHLVNRYYDDMGYKALIANCDLAIGSRYHFCVFAASEYVPFLGIASGEYQRTKLKGLAGLCQIEGCYFPKNMGETDISEVFPYIDFLFENLLDVKQKLKQIVPELKKESETTMEYVLDYLK